MNTIEQEQQTVTIDGSVYSQETGEFLRFVDKQQFKIDTEEAANWVLCKMQTAAALVQSIENSTEVLAAKAILANADAMKKDAQRRYDGLDARFGAELAQ